MIISVFPSKFISKNLIVSFFFQFFTKLQKILDEKKKCHSFLRSFENHFKFVKEMQNFLLIFTKLQKTF